MNMHIFYEYIWKSVHYDQASETNAANFVNLLVINSR